MSVENELSNDDIVKLQQVLYTETQTLFQNRLHEVVEKLKEVGHEYPGNAVISIVGGLMASVVMNIQDASGMDTGDILVKLIERYGQVMSNFQNDDVGMIAQEGEQS